MKSKRQISCFLENPASQPKFDRPRTTIDFIALKRLIVDLDSTASDILQKSFDACHATGNPLDYELHLVLTGFENKKIAYGSFFTFFSFFFYVNNQ